MTAKRPRFLGWVLLLAALALLLGVVLYVRKMPEPATGTGAGRGLIERAAPAPAAAPEIVVPSEDRRPAAPGEPEPAEAGSVTGRVRSTDGRAVRGARVEAFRGSPLAAPLFAPAVALGKRAPVDGAGRFTLHDLAPMSDLMLRADGQDFAATDCGPFVVEAGRVTDVGDLLVPTGLSITGGVFDARGAAVGGAHVALFQGFTLAETGEGPPRPVRLVVTDARGRFEIPHVQPAAFLLRAQASGHGNAELHGAPPPGGTGIDVTILLPESRPLGGRVSAQEGGAPLAGARVTAVALQAGLGGSETTTDAQGGFAFDDLAPGRYTVHASAKGHCEATAPAATEDGEAFVELQLVAQGSLSGFVVGDDGQPVTHFDLQPQYRQRPQDPPEPRGDYRRITDADGAFLIDGLDPGHWSVQVWAKGYAVTESDLLRVQPTQHVGGLSVCLQRGATLSGLVLDTAGQPVRGAEVWLNENRQPAVDQPGLIERPRLSRSARSDASGRYAVAEITPGVFQVVVDHPDFALLRRDDVAASAGAEQELPPLVLERAATLQGVATADNGQVLAGVSVYLSDPLGHGRQTTTDGAGRFLFQRLGAGEYRLACYGRDPSLASLLGAQMNPSASFFIAPGETATRNVVASN